MSPDYAPTDLRYEHVKCALCGQDDTAEKFTIQSSRLKLAKVWIDNVKYLTRDMETLVTCKTCGLVYVNPRLASYPNLTTYSFEQEQAYFVHSHQAKQIAFDKLMGQLAQWLGRSPQNLLDIGCGDGVLLEIARKAGINSVGFEVSAHLIDLVRDRLGAEAVINCDLNSLPANSYDVICLMNVLEHLRDPQDILATAARLLKPDGILLVHVPNFGGLPAKIKGSHWHHIEPLEHFYYFTAQTLTALMQQAGLEPMARFNLTTSTGLQAMIQGLLEKLGIYIDNGLGIVARRLT